MAHTLTFGVMYEYDAASSGITIPVVLSIGQNREKTLAKLDTGASCCVFKREHGLALGLDIESGVRQVIGTATEPFLAYGHHVTLLALGFQLDAMVYFASRVGLPRNVLGRQGWIEQMRLGIVDYERKLYISLYNDEV